jgi:hypothetical protein
MSLRRLTEPSSGPTALDTTAERPQDTIRVKLISRFPPEHWAHQLPHGDCRWRRCEFLFRRDASDYDWLAVYDDIPPEAGKPKSSGREELACPASNSILVTTEPSSIKIYGHDYTGQFGAVLTSQEAWALPHPQRIYSQPALHWFYGVGSKRIVPFDEIESHPPASKTRDLSMVFSPKSMRHTLHWRRNEFMQYLMSQMPEMDVFGRGARPLDDKAEAVDDYRYHVAIENFIGPHHWTEKLADAFLGMTLPFYCGCPNAAEYFPPDSFIPIDIHDPEAAVRTIRNAIADHEYERRLPAILDARRLVMRKYNLFAVLDREISRLHLPDSNSPRGQVILSRHAVRHSSPAAALRDIYGKLRGRLVHRVRESMVRR